MFVHDVSFLPAEHQQQVAFTRRQMLTVERLMQRVEDETVEAEHLLLALLEGSDSPEDSLDAADEYIHREWFGLIVVAAELERTHLILAVTARREHDERDGRKTMTDILEQFVAVHPDALQFHQHYIPVTGCQYIQSGFGISCCLRFVSTTGQIVTQNGRETDVTIYDEYLLFHLRCKGTTKIAHMQIFELKIKNYELKICIFQIFVVILPSELKIEN